MVNLKRIAALSLALGAVALSAACGSGSSTTTTVSAPAAGGGSSKVLVGAGSTFVAPLVAQWEAAYAKTPAAVTVTYGAVGSGSGIDAITARSVDFGASDAPMTPDQMTACKGCVQIPWALGATTVDYNVKGVPTHLHLTGPVLANIFLGKVTTWDDPSIKALNPGVSLPATHITPIYRSDGSGTSFVFTDYLSSVSPTWKSQVGASTQPTFPTGTGAEHSSGVIAAMQATNGGITYAETSYIAADKLTYALIQNAAGKYPDPTNNSAVLAATKSGTTRSDGTIKLVDPPASNTSAYPLSSYTYVIVPKSSPKAATLRAFLNYAVSPTGQAFGPPIGYPALPSSVVSQAKMLIAEIK